MDLFLRRFNYWTHDVAHEVPLVSGEEVTALTNTLPIRRLRLAIGECAEITAAYIAFPELTVSPNPQRYTRLSSDRYRYESLDTDFVREITVDEHGIVITYPDLFHRVW
jgi:hypothetical protein